MVIQIVMGSIFLFFSILMFILFNFVPGDVQGSLLAANLMLYQKISEKFLILRK